MAAAGIAEAILKILLEAEDRSKPAIEGAEQNVGKLEQRLTLGKAAVAGLAGALSGGLVAGLSESAKWAAEEEIGIARMQTALGNTRDAGERWTSQIDKMIEKGQSLSFSDDQTRSGLAALAMSTGSTEEALKRLPLAMDIARARHVDLETAARLVGKVTDENIKVFQRWGIEIPKGSDAAEALAKVQAAVAGQSVAYANTTQGAIDRIGIAFQNLKENVGSALGPFQGLFAVLPGAVPMITALATSLEFLSVTQNRATLSHIAHAAVMAPLTVLTGAFTIAQAALNLVMSLNPIAIVVLALAGLAVALKFAYDNSEVFRGAVQTLFGWIVNLLAPLGWLKDRVVDVATSIGLIGPSSSKMQSEGSASFAGFEGSAGGSLDHISSKLKTMSYDVQTLITRFEQLRLAESGVNTSLSGGGGNNPGPGPSLTFDEGGVVPGPVGTPHTAIVHGGEVVLTPAQAGARGGGGITIGSIVINGDIDSSRRVDELADAIGQTIMRRFTVSGAFQA